MERLEACEYLSRAIDAYDSDYYGSCKSEQPPRVTNDGRHGEIGGGSGNGGDGSNKGHGMSNQEARFTRLEEDQRVTKEMLIKLNESAATKDGLNEIKTLLTRMEGKIDGIENKVNQCVTVATIRLYMLLGAGAILGGIWWAAQQLILPYLQAAGRAAGVAH